MICYKDMTFCNVGCNNKDCHRNLTEQIMKKAEDWWWSFMDKGKYPDSGPLIAVSDFSKDCSEYQPQKMEKP